jgi:HEAT repeat protein
MNKPLLLGLLIGLLAGSGMMAFVMSRQFAAYDDTRSKKAAAREAEVKKRESALNDQREADARRIADLEKQVAAKSAEVEKLKAPKSDAPPPPPPAEAPASKPDLAAKFAALAEKGLAAYGGADFQEVAKLVKEGGKEAIELLAKSLLKGAKSGERFIAAALMEAAGDAAAIPALAEALKSDTDLMVRRMASHAIALIGTDAAAAPLQSAMTADKDWGVRVNSAYGMAKLGREDGLTMLQNAYSSADTPAMYRGAILSGLADVAAPSTAPLFRKILSDTKDETYLFIAISAVTKMKDAGARPDLERIVSSELPESIREAARKALEAIGN